jgi:hypothetical protein
LIVRRFQEISLACVVSLLAGCGTSSTTQLDGSTTKDAQTMDATSLDGTAHDAETLDASSDAGVIAPRNHRPDDSQCRAVRAPGNCQLMQAMCLEDSMCTSGSDGRCVETAGGALTCLCTYDACTKDTDCPAGQLCVCHDSAFTSGMGNTCLMGNCRVDSDCGPNGFCSPSHGTSGCGGVTGYFCHTASDRCADDADCGGGAKVCAWSSMDARWECQPELLCP